jgi:hypothetical protein
MDKSTIVVTTLLGVTDSYLPLELPLQKYVLFVRKDAEHERNGDNDKVVRSPS